jgi:hypothetical protein
VNSAVVLLASANDKHPRGLANSSDQVGRNFMYHQADALLAISTDFNADAYTKTWGTNDFYLKDTDPAYPYPLGQVQPVGSFHSRDDEGRRAAADAGFCDRGNEAPRRSVVADHRRPARPREPGDAAQCDSALGREPAAWCCGRAPRGRYRRGKRDGDGVRQRSEADQALVYAEQREVVSSG